MNGSFLTPALSALPSLTVASAAYFNAFVPDPATGTIFGPLLGEGTSVTAVSITDGKVADELQMSSLLALEELDVFQRSLREHGIGPPAELPPGPSSIPAREGELWFLQRYAARFGRSPHGTARLVRPPACQIELDFYDPAQSRYTVGFLSQAAEVSQSITVDSMDHSVLTDCYSFRVRSVPFGNAVRMALLLSAVVYSGDLYGGTDDLGALQFRHGESGDWIDVASEGGRFLMEDLPVDDGAELSFASTRSVFEVRDFREPVYRTDLLFDNEPGKRDVEIVFYRPLERLQKLMPLPGSLRRALWDPILQRILGVQSGNRTYVSGE